MKTIMMMVMVTIGSIDPLTLSLQVMIWKEVMEMTETESTLRIEDQSGRGYVKHYLGVVKEKSEVKIKRIKHSTW